MQVASKADTVRAVENKLSLLVELTSVLAREIEMDRVLDFASERLAEALAAERATIWVLESRSQTLLGRSPNRDQLERVVLKLGQGIAGVVAESGETIALADVRRDPRFHRAVDEATGFVTRNMLAVPVRSAPNKPIRGVIQVLNAQGGAFAPDDAEFLRALAAQLSQALELTSWAPRERGFSLDGPINRIIGASDALNPVYKRIAQASRVDATLLLRGETGTGKSLFARAVHANSARQNKPFVTVDATTLPSELIESELFGHERGAFTGAERRVIGKVEQAQGGTLFLDEVGELPLALQGKLLRLLSERKYARVGSRDELTADVRFVSATHRDLEKGVREGWFREDLYYRLRVIEVTVPPLRSRGVEDREKLAMHFARDAARRYGRPDPKIDQTAWAAIQCHAFPGNVRELEHWIESAVALSEDGTLRADAFPRRRSLAPDHPSQLASSIALLPKERVPQSRALGPEASDSPEAWRMQAMTMDEMQKGFAKWTLDQCKGNQTECAKRLDISRNTLRKLIGA
jgi:DNA-binding NtrC family response regulator